MQKNTVDFEDRSEGVHIRMTLNEAIKHCEERIDCSECGKEHKQLAEWLTELNMIKNIEEVFVQFLGLLSDLKNKVYPPDNLTKMLNEFVEKSKVSLEVEFLNMEKKRLTKHGAVTQKDINKLLGLSNENQFGRNEAYFKLQYYEDLEEKGEDLNIKFAELMRATKGESNVRND